MRPVDGPPGGILESLQREWRAQMKELRVREGEPGMVLARPILDRMGRVLLPQGEILSEPILERLEAWGVIEFCVQDDAARLLEETVVDEETSESEELQVVKDRIALQFAPHEGNRMMEEVRDAVRNALFRESIEDETADGAS